MTNSQPEPKLLQTFLLHAAFLTLLFAVLPALDSAYAFAFKSAGNALFGSFGSGLSVEYAWVPPAERKDRGEIRMIGRSDVQPTPVWESTYTVRDRGYLPTATLIALILAAPATRRRTALAVPGGFVVLNLIFLAETGLLAATTFATASSELLPLGRVLAAIHPTNRAFFGSPLVRYAAVFAVWAVFVNPARVLDLSAVTNWLRGSKAKPKDRG